MTKIAHVGRLALLAWLVAELAACGGGGGSTPPPPPPPPPATVQSFTPADAATLVDVQSTLTITFDKSLDATSVTRAHVTLVAQGVPVATKVTYDDATHSVHVDPMGLDYGRTYTLSISGLVDTNGQAVAGRHAAFSTWVNGETSGVYLRANTTSPTLHQAQIDTFDATGAPTGYYFSNDPGPDGTWGTADDVPWGGYFTQTYTSDGKFVSTIGYGAGLDGVLHTADDTPTLFEKRTFLPDGAVATDDRFNVVTPFGSSVPEAFTTYAYNADGTLKMASVATGKGADGVWGTADDIVSWTVTYTYDDFGHVALEQTWDVGPDGVFGTPDDVPYSHLQHFYLANGRVDHVDYYYQADYNQPDNTLGEIDTYTYDNDNNNVKLVYGFPDNDVYGYTLISYDAHHRRQTRQYFDQPGADGTWFTSDDGRALLRTYDTTK